MKSHVITACRRVRLARHGDGRCWHQVRWFPHGERGSDVAVTWLSPHKPSLAETQEGNHGTEARTEIQILPAEGEEKKAANADQETADT